MAERMLRDGDKGACNILGRNEECVSKRDGKYMNVKEKYEKSCPVCRLFGSNVLKSRITFGDAYVKGDYKIGKRTCVAIDRITGAAKPNALYDMEYIEQGTFSENIKLQNFENYQIRLLLCLIEEMNEGFLTLGGMTSKGFGCMRAENVTLTLRYYSNDKNLEKKGYSNKDSFYYYKKTVEGLEALKELVNKVEFDTVRGAGVGNVEAI